MKRSLLNEEVGVDALGMALLSEIQKAAVGVDPASAQALAIKRAAALVTNITADKRRAVARLTARAIRDGEPDAVLAERIETVVGLDDRGSQAVERYRLGLIARGMPRGDARRQARAYAKRLRSQRAELIARTELAAVTADAKRQLWAEWKNTGQIDQYAVRVWHTHPTEMSCPVCRPMNGQRAAIGRSYTKGMAGPPVHPNCRCTETLERGPDVIGKGDKPGHPFRGNQWTKYARDLLGFAAVSRSDAKAQGFTDGPYYHATDFAEEVLAEGFRTKGAEKWQIMNYGEMEELKRFGSASQVWMARNKEDVKNDDGGYGKDVLEVWVKPGKLKVADGMTMAGGFYVNDPKDAIPIIPDVSKAKDGDGDGWVDDGKPTMRPAPIDFNKLGATYDNHQAQQDAIAEFDALDDDALVRVYHGTTKEHAEALKDATITIGLDRDKKFASWSEGLYVAPTIRDAANYGDAVVTFIVRKKYILPSKEAGNHTAGHAFMNTSGGAVILPGHRIKAEVVSKLDSSFKYRQLVR